MTPEDVLARVRGIAALCLDRETAHGEEDALRADVLRAIASGECRDPAACAAAAMETEAIEFERWCA